jgi:hypothetical protein
VRWWRTDLRLSPAAACGRGVEGGLVDGPGLLHHDATVHGAVLLEEGADGGLPVRLPLFG